jgi:5-oxoprolinase (ATP-hydrolysing) subunit C
MIEVIRTAPLLSVQDTGRQHFRHLGIPQAGMMDSFALRQANLLLNNSPDAAGLEISFGPVLLRTREDIEIVLMGTDMSAQLLSPDGQHELRQLTHGFVHRIPAAHHVALGTAAIPGQRACLAVCGGIDVPVMLGSRSTDLNNGFGGLEGRALRAGDTLPLGPTHSTSSSLPQVGVRQQQPGTRLRAIRGIDYGLFQTRARSAFWNTPWRVNPMSNRMGVRLGGEVLHINAEKLRLSTGTLPGMIQIPADGQPIILAADAQTTGGYPCLASVIAADLWQLAYLTPGSAISFSEVSIAEAQGLAARQQQDLMMLEDNLKRLRATTTTTQAHPG